MGPADHASDATRLHVYEHASLEIATGGGDERVPGAEEQGQPLANLIHFRLKAQGQVRGKPIQDASVALVRWYVDAMRQRWPADPATNDESVMLAGTGPGAGAERQGTGTESDGETGHNTRMQREH